LHNPKVLLLDEPASGLDPRARVELMALLRELRKMGKTILVSSHILADLSDISDRVAIMEQGRMVACDRQENLARQIRQGTVLCLRVKRDLERACTLLAEMPEVVNVHEVEGEIELTLNVDSEDHNFILERLIEAAIPIASFSERLPDLAEVFMHVTTGEM